MQKVFVDASDQPAQVRAVQGRWWEQDPYKVHEHVFQQVAVTRATYKRKLHAMKRYERMYETGDLTLYYELISKSASRPFLHGRLIYNVLKSCVDTAASKIAKTKPRPFYLSDKDSWDMGRRARAMTKFMEGQFASIGIGLGDEKSLYGIGRKVFVKGAVQGIGGMKFYRDGDKVCAEPVRMENIVIDPLEAFFGYRRNLHETIILPREIVLDWYKGETDKQNLIKAAKTAKHKDYQNYMLGTDFIEVVESIHLPSGAEATDGRKTISIANGTLSDDKYERPYFPYLFWNWTPALTGFYGIGLGDELFGIQWEINKVLFDIQRSLHLFARPQVWLDYESKILGQQMTNEIGAQRYFKGRPPVFVTPGAMSGEVYNHLENLYRKAFEITGISLMAATSQKPAGLNSGVALREYNDIHSERFALQQLRYEEMFMDACTIIEDLCDDIAKDGGNPMSQVKTGKYLERYTWNDIKLPKDRRVVRPHPSNILPTEPAGKLQTVQEMMQAGFFDKDEAMDLLDYPDLKPIRRIRTASKNVIMMMLEEMVDKKRVIQPEPYMDLEMARTIAQHFYLDLKLQKCPEDRLEIVRNFQMAIKDAITKRQMGEIDTVPDGEPPLSPPPPPVDPMAAAAADPTLQTAEPQAPQTSDLLPVGV